MTTIISSDGNQAQALAREADVSGSPNPSVTNHSSPAAKIKLFRSLFRGREDVYPRRFESRKTGKSGYSPACANCPEPLRNWRHSCYIALTAWIAAKALTAKKYSAGFGKG